MKHLYFKAILLCCCLFASINTFAYDAEIDGIYYNFISENEAEVTYRDNSSNRYSDAIVIPESVTYGGKTYSVTSIGNSAFSNCASLTAVTIPQSLSDIGHWAFQGCRALTNIVIPNGVPVINQGVFSSCTSLKSVYIPEGVTSIGISAFSNCSSLASITIPNDVTSIGNGAFSGCRSLTSITIPEGITSIGFSTFSGCSGLKSVVIPNSVISIGGGAFQNCSSLASVNIPAGVTNIDNEAFYGCNSLTDVYCYAVEPPSVKTRFEDEIWDGYPFNQYFIKEHTTLHVPAGSLEKYKTALRWSDFGTIVGIPEEYYPEGTKWTEIRLDTLKYNSWYSKVGEDWVPNFETIEYRVQGEYTDMGEVYKKVYSNGPEWTDSLAFLLLESRQNVEMTVIADGYALLPGVAYQFNWSVGKGIYYRDILESNSTGEYPYYFFFGVIKEIKEGDFGGVRPLKYVDLDGKAPDNTYEYWDWGYTDTRGGRIIQGIGITEWNDGECLFGPPDPYYAGYGWRGDYKSRHYRSMLVHFERNNEVLYDVWPKKETPSGITIKDSQTANQGTLFDLQGRRVDKITQPGIYIRDGRKVLVK